MDKLITLYTLNSSTEWKKPLIQCTFKSSCFYFPLNYIFSPCNTFASSMAVDSTACTGEGTWNFLTTPEQGWHLEFLRFQVRKLLEMEIITDLLKMSTHYGRIGFLKRRNMSTWLSERSWRVSYSQRSVFSTQSHYITELFQMKHSDWERRSLKGKWLTCWLTSLKWINRFNDTKSAGINKTCLEVEM